MRNFLAKSETNYKKYFPALFIIDYILLLCFECKFENQRYMTGFLTLLVGLLSVGNLSLLAKKKVKKSVFILIFPAVIILLTMIRIILTRTVVPKDLRSLVLILNASAAAFPVVFVHDEDNGKLFDQILARTNTITFICMSLVLLGAVTGQAISFFNGTFVFGLKYSASGRLKISMLSMHQYITGYIAVFYSFISLYLLSKARTWIVKGWYSISAVVFITVAVLSGSRNIWISLLIGGIMVIYIYLSKLIKNRKILICITLFSLAAAFMILVLISGYLYTSVLHSRRDIFYALSTLTSRTTVWKGWFALIKDRPSALLLGLSISEMPSVMNYYIALKDSVSHMHSTLVQALCISGIFGAITILIYTYIVISRTVRILSDSSENTKTADRLLMIPVIIVMQISLFEPLVFVSKVSLPVNFIFYLIFGSIISLSDPLKDAAPVPEKRRMRVSSLIAILACLMPVLLLGYAYYAPAESEDETAPSDANDLYVQRDLIPAAPFVDADALSYTFWQKDEGNAVIMTPEEIRQFNEANSQMVESGNAAVSLRSIPEIFDGSFVKDLVSETAIPSAPESYYINGTPTTAEYWKSLEDNMALASIPDQVSVKYGYSVRRSSLRQFPGSGSVFEENDLLFDKMIRSDCSPFQPLCVVHESRDNEWYYVIMYGYSGWIEKDAVALCASREDWISRQEKDAFIVVISDELRLPTEPYQMNLSDMILPMGTKLPLCDIAEIPNEISARKGYGCYTVKLPTRDDNGYIEDTYCLIPADHKVHYGYLDYTANNLIEQAFKCQGCRYGWAGDYNAFDCSGFTHAVFSCFGIELPRAAKAQMKLLGADHGNFTGMNERRRQEKIADLPVGTLLFFDGHIMLYLGSIGSEPYVISSVSSVCYWDESRSWITDAMNVNTVSVMNMAHTYRSSAYSWLNAVSEYCIVTYEP